MISRALGPSVATIQTLDISPKMIARFNELAPSSEISLVQKWRAIENNLLTNFKPPAALDGPEFHDFDIAAVGGCLHHPQDPGRAIERLARRLRIIGVWVIVDFVEEKERGWLPTSADYTIDKRGFCESEMRALMERRGGGILGGWRCRSGWRWGLVCIEKFREGGFGQSSEEVVPDRSVVVWRISWICLG